MNLVVHQLLSFQNPKWQIGNHMGEVVKGNKYLDFEEEIQKGILLHRFIDSYSDAHPAVKNSTKTLHKNHHKFSPIIIDVYYDFLLIKNWTEFSEISFHDFKENCYSLFLENMELFSTKLKQFTQALIDYDWFSAYGTYDGLEVTLKNMGARTKFQNNMHLAVKDLYMNEENFEQDFLEFLPDMISKSKNFLGLK